MNTFSEMRTQIKQFRLTSDNAAAVRDAAIADANDKYGNPIRERKIVEAKERYRADTYLARKDIISNIEEFRIKKLEQLEKSVAKAPTVEQATKLEELRNRKNLDGDELQIVANSMGDCYGALRSLRDIADANGHYISVPDYKDIRADINEACDYAISIIDMDRDSYRAAEFLGDYTDTIWEKHTEPLDTDALCAIPKVEKRHLTESESAMLDKLFGDVSADELTSEVNKAAESAEMRKLIEMSAVYSTFLEG